MQRVSKSWRAQKESRKRHPDKSEENSQLKLSDEIIVALVTAVCVLGLNASFTSLTHLTRLSLFRPRSPRISLSGICSPDNPATRAGCAYLGHNDRDRVAVSARFLRTDEQLK